MANIKVWTTEGVGDFMFALNRLYTVSHRTKMKINAEFNWYHDKNMLWHFEDPETIYERFIHIHNLYANKNMIKIKHVFNSTDKDLIDEKFRVDDVRLNFFLKREFWDNEWHFKETIALPVQENKIVIWRATFNASEAREWKRVVTNEMWDEAIDVFKWMGYNVVELTYRSPVREAMYHINTCAFVVCYDGMWHYVAKNFWKPMIVASRSTITKYHTPHALRLSELERVPEANFLRRIKNFHTVLPGDELTTYQEMMKCRDDELYDYRMRLNAYRSRGHRDKWWL